MRNFVLNNENFLKILVLVAVLLSAVTLLVKPLNFGIEFTGGVVLETAAASGRLGEHDVFSEIGVQVESSEYGSTIKIGDNASDHVTEIKAILGDELLSEEIIGAALGNEMIESSLVSLAIALGAMSLYLAIRFNLIMAFAAMAALVQDMLISLAFLSLFSFEINTLIVGALMTIIGYSINDSVVTLDKIRELRRDGESDGDDDLYKSVVSVIFKRTIITSCSTLLVLVALGLFGGSTLNGFAAALSIGVVSGTLSSLVIVLAICSKALKRNPDFVKFTKKPSMEGDL